jgi:hypothetical protein
MPQELEKPATVEMPMLDCRAAPVPSSLNEEARTVDFVASTGARGLRRSWQGDYYEELEVSDAAVRMERLNNGAPFLNTHSSWDTSDVLGVVERAWIENASLMVTVRFSQRDSVAPIFQDIKDGILRHVSIGYMVHQYEVTEKQGEIDIRRGVDWEPMEVSIVPMGFDDAAVSRSAEKVVSQATIIRAPGLTTDGGANMPTKIEQEPTQAAVEVVTGQEQRAFSADDAQQIADEAAKKATSAERKRVSDIQTAVRTAKLGDEFARTLVDNGDTVDVAREKILSAWAEQDESEHTRGIRTSVDGDIVANIRDGAVNALQHRADHSVALTDDGRNFAGMTLLRMCEDLLVRQGVSVRGMSPMELAARALSTSDLSNIAGSVMNRTLLMGYESAPRTFVGVFRQGSANDFRAINRVRLSGAPSLEEVKQNGEFQYGKVSDEKETYSLATYGKILPFSRQTIINDDMDALSRIPMAFGRAAADLESDIVWAIVTANAALQDGVALFHANHDNLAGSGGAITIATLGAAREAMRLQTGMEGRLINVMPRFLIAGAASETVVDQFLATIAPTESGKVVPSSLRSMTPVIEPRLSGNAWYMAADYNQVDTIEYSYLQGNQGVYLETQNGFDVDGIAVKARHDFAAKAIDYRGLYKNSGA